MVNSFRYLCAENYQHRTWFDRVIEKIRRVSFFAAQNIVGCAAFGVIDDDDYNEMRCLR